MLKKSRFYIHFQALRLSSPFMLAMKAVCVLVLATSSASAQRLLQKTVTIDVKNATIPAALAHLSKKNDLQLAYSEGFFTQQKKVTMRCKGRPARAVLAELLDGTGVGFREVGGQLVLYLLEAPVVRDVTLSGFVQDAETGERLIAATVYCPEMGSGTVTNEYGFYSLTLPAAAASLRFSYIGYSEEQVTLVPQRSQHLNLSMKPSLMLSEVIVTPRDTAIGDLLPSPGSLKRFRPDDLRAMPDLGGQNDLLRAMQLLPGIQSGADGIGGMFVRGGNADQNLMLMDGVPVYNADHLMGLFSIYNTSAIRDAKLLKGGIPARYGGRVSSVVDVYTKEGNQTRIGGELAIDLINGRATIHGPLFRKKGSFMVSRRRTHSDFYLLPALSKLLQFEELQNKSYSFKDFNVKLSFDLSSKDKVYLSFYKGKDFFSGDEKYVYDDFTVDENKFQIDWGNTITSLRWNHLFSQKLFSNTSLTFSRYQFRLGFLGKSQYFPDPSMGEEPSTFTYFVGMESRIRDVAWKTDFEYALSPSHYLRFGASLTSQRFRPNTTTQSAEFEGDISLDSLSFDQFFKDGVGKAKLATSFDGYLEDEWRLGQKLSFNTGLRLSGFYADGKYFLLPEPRLSMGYQLNRKHRLTASLTRNTQYLHRVVVFGLLNFPGDYWTPSNRKVAPQKAWQGTVGFEGKLPKNVAFSVEAYYKKMNGMLAFPDSFLFDPLFEDVDPEDFFVTSKGDSRGLELMLRREEGRLGGWAGYALSKTNRQSLGINYGNRYAYNYDRRHELKLFGYYRLSERWMASLNWVYGSPNPQITGGEGNAPAPPGQLNSIRGSAYHRLDMALACTLKAGRTTEYQLKASLYNAYNRKNAAFYTYYSDSQGNVVPKPIHIFGAMPSLSFAMRF